jgi:hypothetical protein
MRNCELIYDLRLMIYDWAERELLRRSAWCKKRPRTNSRPQIVDRLVQPIINHQSYIINELQPFCSSSTLSTSSACLSVLAL